MDLALILCGLIASLLALLGRLVNKRWRRQAMIQQHGCQPIVKYPSTERFNRDYDRIIKESFQNGHVNKTAMEQYDKCNSSTFQVLAVDDRVILTCDPENMRVIHTSEDWIRDVRRAGFHFSGKDNVLNQIGAAWKQTRMLINPLFKRAELKEIEHFGKFVDRFIRLIPRDGRAHDLQPLIRRLFLDHTSEFVFGSTFDSLREPEKADNFMSTFRRAQSTAARRIRPTGLQLWLNNLVNWDWQWRADCGVVHSFIDQKIEQHRAKKEQQTSERYILLDGMSKQVPSTVALRSKLLGIFASGVENGALLFSNCIFLLARNPDVWAELREQALAFGDSDKLTFEELHSQKYLWYTIQETLRIHTPVPRTRRIAARDTVLPRGGGPQGTAPVLITKGTTIWGDRYPASFDKNVWGEDVDAFRPSRFEGRRVGWEFHPFGGGPRVCPANQQVVVQCMYLLWRLLREFERVENRDPCEEFVEACPTVLQSKNGCKVAFPTAQ